MGVAVGGPTLEAPRADVAVAGADAHDDADPTRTERRRWQFWRSPDDQPRWARPALLAIAALAALSYGWGMAGDGLETFYAASVRSMSESWHNFFLAAYDPWGTVSVDKLPGAFWVQALSVRLFGFHVWAVVLPQVVEGVLTVLVLYRVVRRIAGPGAGLVAAVALAATPITILLNRGNLADSLLLLLLVLAADAATRAFLTGRLAPLLMAGVWMGLAFQAKMLQAWLVLPALYLAYLVAAPALSLSRRYAHVALSALVALAISLSWMTAVSLVPAHDRPYADASCNNSWFSQTFLYNGADRLSGADLTQPGCSAPAAAVPAGRAGTGTTEALSKGPGRFLSGPFGRDVAWLLVPALASFGGILVARRRRPRTDPWRAAALMWGAWLFLTWAFFASSHMLNSYYMAAFAPALAALCGLGLALAWRMRDESRAVPAVVMGTVAVGAAYAVALVPADAGVRPWVVATSVLATGGALVCLALSLRRERPRWALRSGIGLGALALLLGSAWASATAVGAGLGPFDSPYQPVALTSAGQSAFQKAEAGWPALAARADRYPAMQSVATQENSSDVSMDIVATGREFLAVGGHTGQVPATPLPRFVADVRQGRIARVVVAVDPASRNPDMRWVVAHCPRGRSGVATLPTDGVTYRWYLCTPADAG
jgi:4-amino-4-deoxy-L-arabinose transferase-like glycosyltransferase